MPKILWKRRDDIIAALKKSVGSILAADDIDKTIKRSELAETFAQFQVYMDRAAGAPMGKGVLERVQRRYREKFEKIFNKVDGSGHDLNQWARDLPSSSPNGDGDNDGGGGGAVDHHASKVADLLVESGSCASRREALQHLLHTSHGQALLARMHKRKEPDMGTPTLEKILKDYGVVRICKYIVEKGRTGYSEHELVAALTAYASEQYPTLSAEQAFAKLLESDASILQACNIAKSPPWSRTMPYISFRTVTDDEFEPVVVVGGDLRDQADVDEAWDQLCEIGRAKAPAATPEQQFAIAFSDPKNASLAMRVHRRPAPSTVFPMPFAAQGAVKSDRTGGEGTAYDELMAKAEQYRSAHPDLSIAQCFERVYTDRANVELAKRERVENTPTSYGS
jgi:hypothetical protein